MRSRAIAELADKALFRFHRRGAEFRGLQAALNVLGAKAQFEGPELPVHLRVGEHDDRLYLDLCDRDWRAVEIGPDGWRVITNPPIRFRRTAGMLPLPQPSQAAPRELAAVPERPLKTDDGRTLGSSWRLLGC